MFANVVVNSLFANVDHANGRSAADPRAPARRKRHGLSPAEPFITQREIVVFRSGAVRVNGVDYPPPRDESPELTSH